jgi:alpha-L-fucosidase
MRSLDSVLLNRREILKRSVLSLGGAVVSGIVNPLLGESQLSGGSGSPADGPATKLTSALAAFEKLRFGCSFHFGIQTFTGNEYDPGNVPATVYDPSALDVRQWVKVAHDMGARYAVLTTKHMSGFCLWNAKDYEYSVAFSGNKTDVVAAFVQACREFGLRHGFYYCILDPRNEGLPNESSWNNPVSDKYFSLVKRQINELHSTYRNTFYQLFDIPWVLSPSQRWELYRLVKSYSPHCIIVNNQGFEKSRINEGRLCEKGSWPSDIINGEDTLPPLTGHDPHIIYEKNQYYMPFETWLPTGPIYPPMPFAHTWFWHPWYKPQSAEVIAEAYWLCMRAKSNLMVNLAPDNTGRIPKDQIETFQRVGELVRGGYPCPGSCL